MTEQNAAGQSNGEGREGLSEIKWPRKVSSKRQQVSRCRNETGVRWWMQTEELCGRRRAAGAGGRKAAATRRSPACHPHPLPTGCSPGGALVWSSQHGVSSALASWARKPHPSQHPQPLVLGSCASSNVHGPPRGAAGSWHPLVHGLGKPEWAEDQRHLYPGLNPRSQLACPRKSLGPKQAALATTTHVFDIRDSLPFHRP